MVKFSVYLNRRVFVMLWLDFCIRFGTKLDRQMVGIPMGTNCAPLVADLCWFCYVMKMIL